MIFINGDIWTGDPANPQAQAIAVTGDRVLAVGSTSQIVKLKEPETEVIDLDSHFVIPGFIDSHVHFLEGGFRLLSVKLRDADTPQDFIKRIADYARGLEPGEWISGGDWDGSSWSELPQRSWIDSVSKENPVFVTRLDGHMGLANTLAMEQAGITDGIGDVAGGEMVRDSDGRLTGIFKDNAMDKIFGKIPAASDNQVDRALQQAMKYVASMGVTSVHQMGGSAAFIHGIERARQNGSLITRIYNTGYLGNEQRALQQQQSETPGDLWMRTGGLKGFVDGSLGSRTAFFFEPYADDSTNSGFLVNSEDDLYLWISRADKAGLQCLIHAIGDKSIHILLNIFERVAKENGPRDRRFRIEHAQHIAPQDIQRFAELGVIASMQPYHAIDDGRWAEKAIGPQRIETTYAFRSLLNSGAMLSFGSDWFVAPPSALEGIYAAVTRRTLDGRYPGGWVTEQKISAEQALIAYTRDAAYAAFEEDIKGSLEAGKLADFVMLSENLFDADPVKIRDVHVLQTWAGGKKVYDDAE